MTAQPIFIGGTASHVGKSWIATAICRYLAQEGLRVAPFKAQNMSNNSMVCEDGGEIGRSQAAQAEACGLAPHTDMNPILLKPTGRLGSQLVLNGKPWRNVQASDYSGHFEFLSGQVMDSYQRLAARYQYIVIEGAGSVAELNLGTHDLVNLGFARRLQAPAIIVADIDRGGVFASVIGTLALLPPGDAGLFRSFLINRFRGDTAFFSDGVKILQERTGLPSLGIFPYAPDIYLDEEDAVSLDSGGKTGTGAAIVRLPHVSNFTDFRLLGDVTYVDRPVNERFATLFLPGTKSPIEDMVWLRTTGMEDWLKDQIEQGARVIGICGGYQMMGREICDPDGIESVMPSVKGLGILPVVTELRRGKTTREVDGRTPSGIPFRAYEIHSGFTSGPDPAEPFAILSDGTREGIRSPRAIGTYLHGAFETKAVLEETLGRIVEPGADKQDHYDRLAEWFRQNADEDLFAREYLGRRTRRRVEPLSSNIDRGSSGKTPGSGLDVPGFGRSQRRLTGGDHGLRRRNPAFAALGPHEQQIAGLGEDYGLVSNLGPAIVTFGLFEADVEERVRRGDDQSVHELIHVGDGLEIPLLCLKKEQAGC
jgi:adenosylcobyric acid synthase